MKVILILGAMAAGLLTSAREAEARVIFSNADSETAYCVGVVFAAADDCWQRGYVDHEVALASKALATVRHMELKQKYGLCEKQGQKLIEGPLRRSRVGFGAIIRNGDHLNWCHADQMG